MRALVGAMPLLLLVGCGADTTSAPDLGVDCTGVPFPPIAGEPCPNLPAQCYNGLECMCVSGVLQCLPPRDMAARDLTTSD